MISKVARLPMMLAIGPALNSHDLVQDVPGKNYRIPEFEDNETGWMRVKRMFMTDEFGRISKELNSVHQAGFMGLFIGAVYGGFLGSKKSYIDFMERNQATAFENHLDAKRKLQDQVTMGFAKNAFRFGWRLALFSVSYTGVSTGIAVYRGKSSVFEYIAAGAATGAMYKFSMGLRGMTAGALVGGFFGTIAGGVSLLLLRATGMTMEEARYWQYKWRSHRDETIREGWKTQVRGTEENEMFAQHDQVVGEGKLDIKLLEPNNSDVKAPKDPVTEKK